MARQLRRETPLKDARHVRIAEQAARWVEDGTIKLSRGGTYNYVVFDPADIAIKAKFALRPQDLAEEAEKRWPGTTGQGDAGPRPARAPPHAAAHPHAAGPRGVSRRHTRSQWMRLGPPGTRSYSRRPRS